MEDKILQNARYCKKCNKFLVSWHVHDYQVCNCVEQVMVDGGFDYLRQSTSGSALNLGYKDSIDTLRQDYLIYDGSQRKYVRFKDATEELLTSFEKRLVYPDFLPIWKKMREGEMTHSLLSDFNLSPTIHLKDFNKRIRIGGWNMDTTDKEGVKHDDGKPDHTLVAKELIDGVARAKGFGADKYGRNNFLGGMNWCRILASASRHLHKFIDGTDNDEESGLSHIDHAAACLEMLMVYRDRGLGTDDRFKGE